MGYYYPGKPTSTVEWLLIDGPLSGTVVSGVPRYQKQLEHEGHKYSAEDYFTGYTPEQGELHYRIGYAMSLRQEELTCFDFGDIQQAIEMSGLKPL